MYNMRHSFRRSQSTLRLITLQLWSLEGSPRYISKYLQKYGHLCVDLDGHEEAHYGDVHSAVDASQ